MDDMSEKMIAQKRAFLNDDSSVSVISAIGYYIKLETWNEELRKEGLYDRSCIDFGMSDCSRKISLQFGIDTKEEMRNALGKLDTIIDICNSMKEDLKLARVELRKGIDREKELKALREKDKK